MKAVPKFYITTPIYYPSASPHLGSAFEVIGIDAMARYKRQCGYEVFFLTGMDEHGSKIRQSALARSLSPREHVDEISGLFRSLWDRLQISYTDFIRTTEERHRRVVRDFFNIVHEKGDIYKAEYEGWYCVRCESFLTETQLTNGKCSECGTDAQRSREPAYFFRLSKYQSFLEKHIEEHPDFIKPDFRRTEIINNFLKPGLQDICITRSTLDWGIPVPVEPSYVIYVWFDALINYLSGIGFRCNKELFEKFWPADIHIVGKDILRFHTLLWPAMLTSAGLPLPRQVFSHGFINIAGQKMSKSAGEVVDPGRLIELYGSDALRFFLLREISYPHDGEYSAEKLVFRINNELSDDLGNLVYRVLSMVERYRDGRVPRPSSSQSSDHPIKSTAETLYGDIFPLMEDFLFNRALDRIWELVRSANQYVETARPWELNKTNEKERLDTVLYNLCEGLRIIADFLAPFMPSTSASIRRQLSLEEAPSLLPEAGRWGQLPPDRLVKKEPPLFPKVSYPGH